jgi:hypothetical protein
MLEITLDYISRELQQLQIIALLPDAADLRTEPLTNRAMDVLSASFTYLARHIRHESGRFGIIGTTASVTNANWDREYCVYLLNR